MNNTRRAAVHDTRMITARTFFLSLLLAPILHAAPAWKSELTSPAPGPFAKPALSTLDLQLSWNGMINSGTVRMEFAPADAKKPGAYVIRSSTASQGPAAALFPYQSNFWSELDPKTLRPRFFQSVETGKKAVTTTVRHSVGRVESREITKQKSGATKQTDKVFKSPAIFDLFSAMLHVRSQKLDAGDKIALVIHPFDNPYLLRVKVAGREVHNGRKTIRLTMGMQKIDRKTQELMPYKKLKKDATLWLSDDADRIPVEIRAAVFIGDVRATLAGHRKS